MDTEQIFRSALVTAQALLESANFAQYNLVASKTSFGGYNDVPDICETLVMHTTNQYGVSIKFMLELELTFQEDLLEGMASLEAYHAPAGETGLFPVHSFVTDDEVYVDVGLDVREQLFKTLETMLETASEIKPDDVALNSDELIFIGAKDID